MSTVPKSGIRCLMDAENFLSAAINPGTPTPDLFICLDLSPKPWTTPYWTAMRSKIIGTQCATCGSKDGPMVLQHGWRRMKINEAMKYATDIVKKRHPYFVPVKTKHIKCCPKCGYSVTYRKTTDDFVCRRGHAAKAGSLSTKEVQDNTAKEAGRRMVAHRRWTLEHKDEIDREALKIIGRDLVRYWSMDGCRTECKRCSYLWDVRPDLLLKSLPEERRPEFIQRHLNRKASLPQSSGGSQN